MLIEEPLTDGQNLLVSVLIFPTALLSILGSTLILWDVWKQTNRNSNSNSNNNNNNSYQRILSGTSVYDIFITVVAVAQRWFTPPLPNNDNDNNDEQERITSLGNQASCQALGLGLQLGVSCYFYNGMLAFYYLVTIVHNWSERRFAKVEPYLHAFAVGFPLVPGIVGVALQWYAPLELGPLCWVNDYPRGCESLQQRCLSGEIGWAFAAGPILVMLALVLYSNGRIYLHVRRVLRRSQRYVFAGRAPLSSSPSPSSAVSPSPPPAQLSATQKKRLRQVRIQSILYPLAFWSTIWPTLVIINMENTQVVVGAEENILWLYILQSLLTPSFGLWTALIYFRPRFLQVRKHYGGTTTTTTATSSSSRQPPQAAMSLWWQVRRTLFGDAVQPTTCNNECSTIESLTKAQKHNNATTLPVAIPSDRMGSHNQNDDDDPVEKTSAFAMTASSREVKDNAPVLLLGGDVDDATEENTECLDTDRMDEILPTQQGNYPPLVVNEADEYNSKPSGRNDRNHSGLNNSNQNVREDLAGMQDGLFRPSLKGERSNSAYGTLLDGFCENDLTNNDDASEGQVDGKQSNNRRGMIKASSERWDSASAHSGTTRSKSLFRGARKTDTPTASSLWSNKCGKIPKNNHSADQQATVGDELSMVMEESVESLRTNSYSEMFMGVAGEHSVDGHCIPSTNGSIS